MCTVSLGIRIAAMLAAIIEVYVYGNEYDKQYWGLRSSCVGWQFILLVLGWKFPKQCTKFMAPVMIPGFTFFNLVPCLTIPMSPALMGASMASLLFYMFNGLLLNYSWIFTSISMSLTSIVCIAFYVIALNFRDLTTFTLFLSMVLMIIYSCYFYEKKLKLEFIQLRQI